MCGTVVSECELKLVCVSVVSECELNLVCVSVVSEGVHGTYWKKAEDIPLLCTRASSHSGCYWGETAFCVPRRGGMNFNPNYWN